MTEIEAQSSRVTRRSEAERLIVHATAFFFRSACFSQSATFFSFPL